MGAAAESTHSGATTDTVAPWRWPLLGHTPSLLRQRFSFTSGLRERGDLVKIYLGPMPAYVVTTPELVHEVLVTQAGKFEQGILFDRFRPHLGNGVAMSNGAFHLRQRRLLQPAFHRERIGHYASTMVDVAQATAHEWRAGQVVEVYQAMQQLAVTVLGRTLFATKLGEAAIAEAQRSVPILVKQVMVRALSPGFLAALPIPGNRAFDAATARFRTVVTEVIAAARAEGTDNGDLLSMLLQAKDADTGESMSEAQVYDEVITILTGGTDTVGLALGWFFHEIGRHPELEQRFHAEVDDVLGGSNATVDDLPKLTYTRQIVNEVLRLYPIWLLIRRTNAEVDLGGHRVPAGTEVVYSPHALHHDPRNFPDPDRFDPDRWSPERIGEIPKGAYVPFGAGARQCIGNAFAQTEIALTAATIAARWRLVPVPDQPVRIKVTGAAYPSRLPMTAQPRHG
ncbi:MAG TPA: cytochrome P450 [Pseudonocardiaceae bacterium]|nr:cytochrome P450 [Pseudonocardiaceae bacterium]